jgi:hypothetical protein
MPGETHQIGYDIDADNVLSLLLTLLCLPEEDEPGDTTLADLDIDGDGALDLWKAGVRSSANGRSARRSTPICSIRL